MTLLSVQAVVKSFAGVVALDQVSFNVAEGELVGIMAANGAKLLGLTRKEVAPKSKTRSKSSPRIEAVRITIAKRLSPGCARTHAKTSKPFLFGIFKSSNMTVGNGNLCRSP